MIDPWFVENLVCPVDHQPLRVDAGGLVCAGDHRYPIVDDVPVMLREDCRTRSAWPMRR